MVSNIIDGYVFKYDDKFYNLNPQSHGGDIIQEILPGDIIYCFYDLDEAECAKQDCIERTKEWYELDLETDEILDYLLDFEPVSVLSVLDEINSLRLVVEASYLC